MENPQLENGYTAIANEIMDALVAFRIPGEERQCLDFIIRKTYGYHKKNDAISNSQFVDATGLKKGNVCRAIKSLVKKGLVIKSDNAVIKNDNKIIPTYRFNKDYSSWKSVIKKDNVINIATVVIKSDNKTLSKVMDTKDNKTTRQKKKILISSSHTELAGLLIAKIKERNPNHKHPDINLWGKEIEKMELIDKRNLIEVKLVILWCQKDLFWQNNILSTKKLREKYDQLVLKMKSTKGGKHDGFAEKEYTGTDPRTIDWIS